MDKRDIRDNLILAVVMLLLMVLACRSALRGGIAYDVQADATSTDATEVTTEGSSDTTTETPTITPDGFSDDDLSNDSDDDDDDSSDSSSSSDSDTTTSNGVSAEELAALTQELTNTLQEKNDLQTTLNALLESQNDFISKLNELDDLILEYQDKLDEIDERTASAQTMMVQLSSEIEEAQQNQDAQYELLKTHIREEYENGSYSFLDAIFDSVDFMDIVSKSEYIQAVEDYDEKVLKDYTNAKQVLADKNALLTMLTSNMDVLAEAYENKQESLQILSDEKESQINSYQESIDSMEAQVKSLEQIEAEVQAKITAAEASYNVSFSVNGSTGSAQYNGAQFLWPMPTSTVISSYYGPRTAPTAGATSYHRGIDIPCSMGSDVIAVADGTVIYVGYLGNGGNAVIVDHGSGISTCYFHLSSYNCSVGDTVTAGQTICYSGNTGVSTGPHLHFAVRENGEYVNPLKYYTMIEDKSSVSDTEGN
ncbi:Murein DD-endopeptidase MepM and murein hydrolase activator NlpD, contain LysM domain [Lachnospiraceae bacterium NE2001]|nr:Murein DD-endopeptidase MepM and murein hydrolase activator NlpD, contain LysM domain [Lachnospiraceae bacterium NE2001]